MARIATLLAALGLAAGASGYFAQAATPVGVGDGVYTDAQALDGKREYARSCSHCHMADLGGGGDEAIPALAGRAFISAWEGQTLGDLFDKMKSAMPQDNPGSLSADAYASVIAYILQENKFPAGASELKPDPALLKTIVITKK